MEDWQKLMMMKKERKRKLAKKKMDLYIVVAGGTRVLETLMVLTMLAVLNQVDTYLNTKPARAHRRHSLYSK